MVRDSRSQKKRISAILSEQAQPLFALANVPSKRVGHTSYYHLVSIGLNNLAQTLAKPLETLCHSRVQPHDIIAKVERDGALSILVYPGFYSRPHPELAASVRFTDKADAVAVRRYKNNPPILHRKELLLGPGHEHYDSACEFTRAEEAAGLLDPPFDFGFKRQWENRLEAMGYEVSGYELLKKDAHSQRN
ncbi:MAG: hypothetical protein ACLFM0_00325 [Spirochaetales bacterium]